MSTQIRIPDDESREIRNIRMCQTSYGEWVENHYAPKDIKKRKAKRKS